ncbi:MAG: helix-turn-helix transcriptional regulator [Clostridia bacterium]|nr:helix-turn-helix transcriptional regulator [Clostridia bacterium]
MLVSEPVNYGEVKLRIEEILKEKGISKNKICKDLDIPRGNFNRYCRNDFQRIDAALLCKLCWYLEVEISELVVYTRPEE